MNASPEDVVKMADASIMSIINQCIEQTRDDRAIVKATYSAEGSGYASKIRDIRRGVYR
jgi:hypothetical protein